MCTKILVCHGDKFAHAEYTDEQKNKSESDCKPASYYITNDGKYAIDADYVDVDNLDDVDLDSVPKIPLNPKS
jgi:hypothetical protein